MKSMLHGLPQPFITIDRHCETGEVFTWSDRPPIEDRYFEVYKCGTIGDNPESQLQNVYLREVEE